MLWLSPSLEPGSFSIRFQGGGNDFIGSLIITSTEILKKPVSITFEGSPIKCRRQLHGYYFNVARWIQVLPLSHQDESIGNPITIPNDGNTYWLYTACGYGLDLYDIMGVVSYENAWTPLWSVLFGVTVDETLATNTYSNTRKVWGITWRESNGINGFFFDTMYGVGKISSNGSNSLIGWVSDLLGQFSPIYIQGKVWLGQSIDTDERGILSINLAGTKTLLKSSDESNFSSIINAVQKNASTLCRNRTIISDDGELSSENKNIACLDIGANSNLTIDSSNLSRFTNRDVVLFQWNIILDKSIFNQLSPSNYLSLYIAQGNLIMDQDTTVALQRFVNANDQLLPTSASATTKGVYLFGNFFVNGLVLGADISSFPLTISWIPYKTFIQWRVASLNTLSTVSTQRNKQLVQLLSSREPNFASLSTSGANTYFPDNTWNASLGDLFSRKCDPIKGSAANNGISDGIPGVSSWTIALMDNNTKAAIKDSLCPAGQRYPLTIVQKQLQTQLIR